MRSGERLAERLAERAHLVAKALLEEERRRARGGTRDHAARTFPEARSPPGARAPLPVPPARYNDELELEDAVHTALLTLKEGFEGAMDHTNIEARRPAPALAPGSSPHPNLLSSPPLAPPKVGIVGPDQKFKVLTPAEIQDYLGEVE